MELQDQIKTTRGVLPSKSARLGSYSRGGLKGECIDFELYSPEEVSSLKPDDFAFGEHLTLEGLGLLLRGGGDSAELKSDELRNAAALTGPLFGDSTQESIVAWRCAIMMAHDVIAFQEVVNGNKPLFLAEERIAKTFVKNTHTENEFTIYAISFEIGSPGALEYENFFPVFPWFRKFRSEDSFDYVFVQGEHIKGSSFLSAFLISFSSEITTFDFAAVLGYLKHDVRIGHQVLEFFNKEAGLNGSPQSIESTYGIIAAIESFEVEEAGIEQADIPHIQKIIHALISLHLQGVAVDVFCSAENDGFMVFKNYLSYLWYDFSRKLNQVEIGYCEQCGKGFSLSGHRGIRRRFCGEACKTQAKNARAKKQRDEIRLRFKAGELVQDIAHVYYPDVATEKAVRQIVKNLRSWRELKTDLDAAIISRDASCDLLGRCLSEKVFSQEDILDRARVLAQALHCNTPANGCRNHSMKE